MRKSTNWMGGRGNPQRAIVTALATTNFLYEDFGIPVLNIGGFVSVEDDVTLQVQLIAEKAG